MDPLSILSISCAVMQILSFSGELYEVLARIERDGSPDASLADRTKRFGDLLKNLTNELALNTTQGPLSEPEQRLQKVALKCSEISTKQADLLREIESKSAGPSTNATSPTTRGRWGQSWRWFRWSGKIKKLQLEMNGLQQELQTHILENMWLSDKAKEVDLNNLQDSLTQFIRRCADGHKELNDLIKDEATSIIKEIEIQHEQTRESIATKLDAQQEVRAAQAEISQVVESLRFDHMNDRASKIKDAHEGTFQWAFDDKVNPHWSNVADWLASDGRIFWISGKAGSGKSTLMRFLVDEERTRELLGHWKEEVKIISFFLWNIETPLQRSVRGTLSALLHKVLSLSDDLVSSLLSQRPALKNKQKHGDWRQKELEEVLIWSLNHIPYSICIFLDGLDEIDQKEDGEDEIIQVVNTIHDKTDAKLCVSSRPDKPLEHALGHYPMLRLQDMTKSDITSYVEHYLRDHFQYLDDPESTGRYTGTRKAIVDKVVERASGVFLWVYLVLKSLRSGNVKKDGYDVLLKRISETPPTLEELYKQLWERQPDAKLYRAEAARYLNLVLESKKGYVYPKSLFELAIAHEEDLQKEILENKKFPPVASLIQVTESFAQRAETCCGGLLEIRSIVELDSSIPDQTTSPDDVMTIMMVCDGVLDQFFTPVSVYHNQAGGAIPSSEEREKLWDVSNHRDIDFIHRTAADFLLETKWGQDLLCSAGAKANTYHRLLLRAQLVLGLLFGDCIRDEWSLLRDLNHRYSDTDMMRLVEETYERMVAQTPVTDDLIRLVRKQILAGEFEEPHYKSFCGFVTPYIIKHFKDLFTNELPDFSELPLSNKYYFLLSTVKSLQQMLAKFPVANRIDKDDDIYDQFWPPDFPRFPLPQRRHSSLATREGLEQLAFHILAGGWVVFWARQYHQENSVVLISSFLKSALKNRLQRTIKNIFERSRDFYGNFPNVKEWLLARALFYLKDEGVEIIQYLLESGADPNWIIDDHPDSTFSGSFEKSQEMTSFEWFLVWRALPLLRSENRALDGQIATTISNCLKAGVNLDREICMARDVDAESEWEIADEVLEKNILYQRKYRSEFKIVVKRTSSHLLRDILLRLLNRNPMMSNDFHSTLKHLADISTREFLIIYKFSGATHSWHLFKPSIDDADRILQFFDGKDAVSERRSKDDCRKSAGDIIELAEKICSNGLEVPDHLRPKWSSSEIRYKSSLEYYAEINAEKLFKKLFPKLPPNDSIPIGKDPKLMQDGSK